MDFRLNLLEKEIIQPYEKTLTLDQLKMRFVQYSVHHARKNTFDGYDNGEKYLTLYLHKIECEENDPLGDLPPAGENSVSIQDLLFEQDSNSSSPDNQNDIADNQNDIADNQNDIADTQDDNKNEIADNQNVIADDQDSLIDNHHTPSSAQGNPSEDDLSVQLSHATNLERPNSPEGSSVSEESVIDTKSISTITVNKPLLLLRKISFNSSCLNLETVLDEI